MRSGSGAGVGKVLAAGLMGAIALGAAVEARADSASLTNGLVAWLKADGDTTDSSGNGNDGTWMVTTAAYTNDKNGTAGNAFLVNGTSGRVEIPDAASLDTDYEFSLALWINPRAYFDVPP